LAAHLRAKQVDFRIVGSLMAPWRSAMPAGMCLKSEGFASSLYEPGGAFTLGAYCARQGVPYADIGYPVPVETFIGYGEAFQRRFVPNLEDRTVVDLQQTAGGFEARCADGGSIEARRVVLAPGVLPFSYLPPEVRHLPSPLISHSSDHHDLSLFGGQEIAVIGAGASAMDVAAALRLGGARVTIIARRQSVRFQTPLGARSLFDKIRAPMTTVGPGWKSVFCTKAPLVFHFMPDGFRTDVVRRYLGPAPAWFTRNHIEGHVPIIGGATILSATEKTDRVVLALRLGDQRTQELTADHVIAATGFRVDIARLGLIDAGLRAAIRTVDGAPRLSRHFESSVRNLFFTGPAAANSFGPVLRFAAGAHFASRRLARHLAASAVSSRVAGKGSERRQVATAEV
jgi:cation diffusion facilitator CzcD-associated flavoprotein CzcO